MQKMIYFYALEMSKFFYGFWGFVAYLSHSEIKKKITHLFLMFLWFHILFIHIFHQSVTYFGNVYEIEIQVNIFF